jgi:hypothetical protein
MCTCTCTWDFCNNIIKSRKIAAWADFMIQIYLLSSIYYHVMRLIV